MSSQIVCQHNIRLPVDEGQLTGKTRRKIITSVTKTQKYPKKVETFPERMQNCSRISLQKCHWPAR